MTVFTWLIILLLLAAVLLQGNIKGSNKFIFIAFLLLFAVMGLRDVTTGGSDASGASGSYLVSFQNVGETDWSSLAGKGANQYNIGFSYLMKLLYELTGGDYQLFITIISFFILFSYLRFIRKYSPSPIQSILYFLGLLYYSFLFDALKQAVAMSVLLFAFDAIFENKPFKFVLLVLIASLFHFPALVFLPAYWLGRMRVGSYYLIILAALLFVTYLFRDQILNLMLDAYGNEDLDVSMEGIRFLRTKSIVMIVIVIAAVLLRPPSPEDAVYNACLVFAGIAIVFQTFCGYNNIFERLADYYFHTSIVLLPLVFEKCDLKTHVLSVTDEMSVKSVAPWLFCGFAIWRFMTYMNNSPVYNTFRFLWQ